MSLSTTRKSLYVDFGTPPPGYVPGLGRGAVGFTTKMDIATARFSGPQLPGASTNSSSSKASKSKSSTVSGVPGQFDDAVFEAEDAEADAIWAAVDAKVNRHTEEAQKRKDAAAEAEESQRGIKLHAQFADLRRELTNVTVDEWESIPEVGQVAYVPKQTAGAAAGATLGALTAYAVGGPIGGIIAGGIAGGAAGSAAAEPEESTITYVRENPVDTVYLDGEVVVGAGIPTTVTTYEVPETTYRYVNINGATVIVDNETNLIVDVVR